MSTKTKTVTKTAAKKKGRGNSITRDGSVGAVKCYAPTREFIELNPGLNCRDEYGDIAGFASFLKHYITANGVMLNEMKGYLSEDKRRFVVTDGYRRMASYECLMLGVEGFLGSDFGRFIVEQEPALEANLRDNAEAFELDDEQRAALTAAKFPLFLEKNTDEVSLIARQFISNMTKRFSKYAEAKAFQRMIDAGAKSKDIQAQTGYSPATVSERLQLLTLNEQTADFIAENDISATTALAVTRQARKADVPVEEQPALAEQITKEAQRRAASEGVKVGTAHVEDAASDIAPRNEGSMGDMPMGKNELMAFCADFMDWERLTTSELRRIHKTLSRVPTSQELTQTEVSESALISA